MSEAFYQTRFWLNCEAETIEAFAQELDQIMIKCGLSRDEFRLVITPCLISAFLLSRDDERDKVLAQASRECMQHLDQACKMQNRHELDFVVMDLMKPAYGSLARDAFNRR